MSLTVHLPKPVLWGLALIPSAVLAAITAAVISVAVAASAVRERDLPEPVEPEPASCEDSAVRLVAVERLARATVVSLVKPARPSRSYCTFHGYTGCICGDAA